MVGKALILTDSALRLESGHETGSSTSRLGDMALKLIGMSLILNGMAHKHA